MNSIVKEVLSPFLVDGKIFVPEGCTSVKLDVGLSLNAPNSEYWLREESQLVVYGFEPCGACHESFIARNAEMREKFPQFMFIEPSRINKTFYPIKCALSEGEPRYDKFYVTGNDLGCSSLYEPTYFPVIGEENVPVITLKNFFDVFPWNKIEHIDLIKTDAQGSDYSILVGAGDYLTRVVYITVESSTTNQYSKEDDSGKFTSYLEGFGFKLIREGGLNLTYLNTNLIDRCIGINSKTLEL